MGWDGMGWDGMGWDERELEGDVLVDEVLGTGLDPLALDAHHRFVRHFPRQERITSAATSQNPNLVSFPTTADARIWKENRLTPPSCGQQPEPA